MRLLDSVMRFVQTMFQWLHILLEQANFAVLKADKVVSGLIKDGSMASWQNYVMGAGFSIWIILTYMQFIKVFLNYNGGHRLEPWVSPFIRFALTNVAVLSTPIIYGWMSELTSTMLGNEFGVLDLYGEFMDVYLEYSSAGWWDKAKASLIITLTAFIVFIVLLTLTMSVMVILAVRIFKIIIYLAISPVPMAFFASEKTEQTAYGFLKKLFALLLQGFVILLILHIHSILPNIWDLVGIKVTELNSNEAINAVYKLIFVIPEMIVISFLIKSSDQIAKDMVGA